MDHLANLKTTVETRKVSGNGLLVLDNYSDRIQVGQKRRIFHQFKDFWIINYQTECSWQDIIQTVPQEARYQLQQN